MKIIPCTPTKSENHTVNIHKSEKVKIIPCTPTKSEKSEKSYREKVVYR